MNREDQELWERYGIRSAEASESTGKKFRDVIRTPGRLIFWVLLAIPIWVALEIASAVILTLVFRSGHELPEGLLAAASPTWLVLMAGLALWLAGRLIRRWLVS